MMTTAADELDHLPVREVSRVTSRGSARSLTYLLAVDDPAAGEVLVRWRVPERPDTWVWRCSACSTRTTSAACLHTFAAGIHLATNLLGLNAVGTAPTDTDRTPA